MDKINIKNQCMGCMSFYDNKYDVCPVCGYSKETESTELFHIDPGTILMNRYVIGRALGYGGFGVTYIGWDKKLNRKVAIKEYLPSEFATRMIHSKDLILPNDQKQKKQYIDGMKKFVEEGQRLAALGEIDGIVSMYDSFEANNTAYIVMEYLEGETLSDYLIREGKIDEKKAINLMMPVLESLEKVHQKGIIHRDIAPDNIFVIRDEEGKEKVKLIDFGAARFASTSHSKSLTVVIKKGYSPEEQYRSNGEQGVYTDVYSVAAVMYKMVTGIVPPDAFERRIAIETKKKDILEEPSKYNKNLSDSFVTAILNAMNVKKEDRTPTIADFEEEIVSFEKVKRRGATIKKLDFMRWPLWAKIAVPSFATIAVAIIAFVIIHHFSSPDTQFELEDGMVRVPNLVGVSKDEVEKILTDSNLQVGTINGRFADGDEVEEVVWQSVAAGTVVNKGDFVDYEINMGRRIKNMPNLVGLYLSLDDEDISKSLISAVDASDSTLIEISVLEEYLGIEDLKVINNDNLSCGYIVRQNIKYNTEIRGGDVLEITIGKIVEEKIDGNDRLGEMPNLQFAKVEEAESVIKVLCGAEIKKEEKYDDYVEKGRIISSSPSREEKIGDRVVVNVSKGPEPFNLTDHVVIIGLHEEDAKEIIKENSLQCETWYESDNDDVEVGYVFKYEIKHDKSDESEGKDTVVRGDTVIIYVRSNKETVDVPNVKGKDYSKAKEQLEKLGFDVEINKVASDEYKKGIVADYSPSGSQEKGAKIILYVSKGKERNLKESSTQGPKEKTTETLTKEAEKTQSSEEKKTEKTTENATKKEAKVLASGNFGEFEGFDEKDNLIFSDNVKWILYENGRLFFEGEGKMVNSMWGGEDGPEIRPWEDYIDRVKEVYIDDNITNIAEGLFYEHKKLEKVKFSKNLDKIGMYTFAHCDGIEEISIPDSVKEIDWCAFCSCKKLNRVVFGKNIKSIGEYSFGECVNLKSVVLPSNLKELNFNAFRYCANLKSIELPDKLEKLSLYAYDDFASELEQLVIPKNVKELSGRMNGIKIKVDKNNKTFDSRNNCNAIIKTKTNELISGNEYSTIPDTVTSIGESAFEGCEKIKNIKLNNNITKIGERAYAGCTGLSTIEIPSSITYLGSCAFTGCTNLKEVILPINVTKNMKSCVFKSKKNCYINLITNSNGENKLYLDWIGYKIDADLQIPKGIEIYIPKEIEKIVYNKSEWTSDSEPNSCSGGPEQYISKIQGGNNTAAQKFAETYGIKFENVY